MAAVVIDFFDKTVKLMFACLCLFHESLVLYQQVHSCISIEQLSNWKC